MRPSIRILTALLLLSSIAPFLRVPVALAAPDPSAETTSLPAPAVLATLAAPPKSAALPKPVTPSEADKRAAQLMSRMSLEDKVGQMVQYSVWGDPKPDLQDRIRRGAAGSLLNVKGAKATNDIQRIAFEESRLKIPLLLGLDVIHGYRTIFPVPLASSCMWNPGLIEKAEAVAAREASAAGVRWTFAPMVDIARDPRWGRICEGAGEDPFLGSLYAAAKVRGFQGKDLSSVESIAACVKHYAAYGAAEAGREYNGVDLSEGTLREVYLPPFRAAVAAGARSLMSAFNDLNGVPTSGNPFTLRRILRGEWAFSGVVLSDWASVKELVEHGLAADEKDAARIGVQSGVDMDMVSEVYSKYISQLVMEKRIAPALVDEAVRRILKLKYELGLFERPYVDEGREAGILLAPEHLKTALDVARRSIVLLKNEGGILPLKKDARRIVVIGELAESRKDPLGSWNCDGKDTDVVSMLDGLREKAKDVKVEYVKGASPDPGAASADVEGAVKAAKGADAVLAVMGETEGMSGEAASRTDLGLPGRQQEVLKALKKAGIPFVLVLMNGRPLTIPWEAENASAILETWFLGTQHGRAVADVLFGDFNPEGRLTATFPRVVGQIPLYYASRNTGRPAGGAKWTSKFIDCPNTPQFPFGFGLTYTTFEYTDLKVAPDRSPMKGTVTVTASVKNTGTRDGVETIQLYVRDVAASRTRPVRELKGFKKVPIKAGESVPVTFRLTGKDLAFTNPQMQWVTEPGLFKVWVAPDSAGGLEGSFTLTK